MNPRPVHCHVPILLYHRVADDGSGGLAPYHVTPSAFREQMQFLVKCGCYSVTLEDWAGCIRGQRPLPGRPVVITFEDCSGTFFADAWPVLVETGLRATMLIDAKIVSNGNGEAGRDRERTDWDKLREAQLLGIEIGARHEDLTGQSDDEAARECAAVRAALHDRFGREATAVAFPGCDSNLRLRLLLAVSGYRIGVSTGGRVSTLLDDVMQLPRIEIFGDDDLDAFALKLDLKPDQDRQAPIASPPRQDRSAAPQASASAAQSLGRPEPMSFALTIALSQTGRPGDELARLRTLLTSFVKYFDMSALARFVIVTRPDDLVPVSEAVKAFPIPSVDLVDERDLCPELAENPDTTNSWPNVNQGWHRQQLLKLACHERVHSDFYMTLDADIMFIKPFTSYDLIRDSKSIVNTQTRRDYDRLWLPEDAEKEVTCRIERDQDAARILGMGRRATERFYGETPVVLSTRIVRELIQYLEKRRSPDWRRYLLEQLPWTEYGLYFNFAEAVGLFDRYHVAGGFNSVLGMCDSLWSPPECYADRRTLSSWEIGRVSPESIAVVVQSYLGYPAEAVAARAAELAIL